MTSCRRQAYALNGLNLPRFNLLDRVEEVRDPKKEYSFFYVDDGPVNTQEQLVERLPYTGPGWYWYAAWETPNFPQHKTTKYLAASECIPPEIMDTAFGFVEKCFREAHCLDPRTRWTRK